MALAARARADAGSDALLDWLKSGDAWPGAERPCARRARSRAAPRSGRARRRLAHGALERRCGRLWRRRARRRCGLQRRAPARSAEWLRRAAQALAGQRRLTRSPPTRPAARCSPRSTSMPAAPSAWLQRQRDPLTLASSSRWVDDALEQASFVPGARRRGRRRRRRHHAAGARDAAAVRRGRAARLRRARLGAAPPPHALLRAALARALGLPDAGERAAPRDARLRAAAARAAADACCAAHDGSEPLGAEPAGRALRARAGAPARAFAARGRPAQRASTSQPAPSRRRADRAGARCRAAVARARCEALRACPYRFFALRMLAPARGRRARRRGRQARLRQLAARRAAPLPRERARAATPADAEAARLHADRATRCATSMGSTTADFLPFGASFDAFVPRYVDWLHERDASGARWQAASVELATRRPKLGGRRAARRIDRIDRVAGDDGAVLELIDYKTGSATGAARSVRAARGHAARVLCRADGAAEADGRCAAVYLRARRARAASRRSSTRDVDAQRRSAGRGHRRTTRALRAGAALPALGEGAVCELLRSARPVPARPLGRADEAAAR